MAVDEGQGLTAVQVNAGQATAATEPPPVSAPDPAAPYGQAYTPPPFGPRLKAFLANPGVELKYRGDLRGYYKAAHRAVTWLRRRPLERLASSVLPVDPRLVVDPAIGFRIVPPEGGWAPLEALLRRCREIAAQGAGVQRRRKRQITELVTTSDLTRDPEFLDFALEPRLLAAASAYLGEFPLLTKIAFWHSQGTDSAPDNSQLYHCDHEDARQLKVFVYVSDVDETAGPLTVVPAEVSETIRRALGYTCFTKLADERVDPLIPPGTETMLLGPSGTMVLLDTSRLLHFGSRVASTDRYAVMIQYLSYTNFEMSPWPWLRRYPYAGLVRPQDSPLQRAVLRGHP